MTAAHYVRFIWRNGASGSKVGSQADAECTFATADGDVSAQWALEAFTGHEDASRPRYGTCNDGILRRTATADIIEFG